MTSVPPVPAVPAPPVVPAVPSAAEGAAAEEGRGGGFGARDGERDDKSKAGDSPRLTLFRNENRM